VDKVEILQGCDLAKGLSREEVAKLASVAVPVEYSGGDIIIREEDTTRDIFIIVEGWVSVEIQRYSASPGIPKLQLLKNRGIVGEFSFVDGSRRSANVTAKDSAKLLMLPYEQVSSLMESDYKLGYLLMRNIAVQLCSRIRSANADIGGELIW